VLSGPDRNSGPGSEPVVRLTPTEAFETTPPVENAIRPPLVGLVSITV
jgi:hypothetical protein